MENLVIERLLDFERPETRVRIEADLKRIFFAASVRREFASAALRQAFYEHWMSFYLNHLRHSIYLARVGQEICGYLTGCWNSQEVAEAFHKHTSFKLFADLHTQFPAHLHINMAENARGKGWGGELLQVFLREAGRKGLGVHVVTDPNSRNVKFYERMGFTFRELRSSGATQFLFLGAPPNQLYSEVCGGALNSTVL